ncbi:hypothetical protein COY13_01715 [Candidatus Roizmanbacteria bacterium CG_4_10_14_0_2_um_filter_36_35]|uniref:Uncharacterized protein n=4 Tax=Candidatus Roizmaniibacteriota TaxID=1752723 RepID=A0A2M7BX51_9BACT|nr:MAG: hypothetical protein COV86_02895 [Candidatus Roizmanbacteria bacterium CG11_big_fil_rev_8_21_14_0_20_35_14]PIV11158.1 MAG: hypothetical protein COS50_01615 [Candidatus Roizmanbacteria bacterium CG03_land_8_20_14_0_80_35_26]PIZ68163.1 MAG: hypothetical protein COY13_01715 [Candidatus Roizmanbacteria bacterium CG_4_10_14_0_2_um_filter_36_35]PJC33031.1 MAG: hypothetical protein CO049_01180 [Candidatus Roizmanbacteria bacterium CG_4_9_14_0_2_um_filter_36_12]PJC80541.1 MAG: hypothetical prot
MEINILQTGSTEDLLRRTGYSAINTPDELYVPKMTTAELDDLASKEFRLRSSFKIIIVNEDRDYYIAQHPFLGLWAESKSLSTAKRVLKQKILQLYKKLKALPEDKLGPFPSDCLIYLENHIS